MSIGPAFFILVMVPVGMVALYLLIRLVFAAYFSAKRDYMKTLFADMEGGKDDDRKT